MQLSKRYSKEKLNKEKALTHILKGLLINGLFDSDYLQTHQFNGLLNMIPRHVGDNTAVITFEMEDIVNRFIKQPLTTTLRTLSCLFIC